MSNHPKENVPDRRSHCRGAEFAAICVGVLLLSGLGAGAQEHPATVRGFDPARAYQVSDLDSVDLFNGGLSIRIPIGGRFPVGGELSYGLTLVYSSKAWDFEFVQPSLPGGSSTTRTVPSRLDNAGFGWMLRMGALIDPDDGPGSEDPYINWNYVDPGGGRHAFFDDSSQSGVSHSRDSSYLRMKLHAAGSGVCTAPDPTAPAACRTVELPDGQVHEFHDFGSAGDHDWRITRIRDPHGNAVDVSYDSSGNWTITDPHGREHRVVMTTLPMDGTMRKLVDRVELAAFDLDPLAPDLPAVYDFHYVSKDISPGCTDNDRGFDPPPTVQVQMLDSVTLPDDTSFVIGAAGYTGGCSQGLLTRLGLPTGGSIGYSYSPWHIPMTCNDGTIEWAERSPGVRTRTFYDRQGVAVGHWLYEHRLGPSVPDTPLCQDPLVSGPSEYKTTTVTAPDGHRTTHYFSVWPHPIPSQGSPTPYNFQLEEYALPFSRHESVVDPGRTRYLSSVTEQCDGAVCEVIRQTFVEYEDDGGCGYVNSDSPSTDCNRRLRSRRTVFVDDGGRYVDVDSSDFDGLGHFRRQRVSGNFPQGGTERVTYTNFNPGRGSTDDGTFGRPGANERWILNTFDHRWAEEGGERAFTGTCFDLDTGLLLGERRYRQVAPGSGTPGETVNDLLTLFSYVGGDLVTERHYGGDVHAAPIGVFNRSPSGDCSLNAAGSPAFRQEHGYQNGSRASSRFVEPANPAVVVLQTLDLTIDGNTGLAQSSRKPNGVETRFEYDELGRLTAEKPTETAWTTYRYETTADPPHVVILGKRSFFPHDVLTERRLEYDGLGRLIRDQRKVPTPGGTGWADTEFRYDALGRKTDESVTVALTYSGEPLPVDMPENWTTFEYDALGRVTKTTAPDGSVATVDYTGDRIVERTVSIDGSPSTTTETYDLHGRLIEVAEPSGVGAVDVATTYGYDFADRLTSVSMNGGVQQRSFDYDPLGFLRSESHPELGFRAGGAQRRVLSSRYDALGNAGRRAVEDGPKLDFLYDLAGRPTQVRDSSGRLLKELFYAHTNDGPFNRRAGKLAMAKRHNYVTDPETGLPTDVVVTETFRYGGRDGQLSEVGIRSNRGPHFEHRVQYDQIGLQRLDLPICSRPPCVAAVGSGREIWQVFKQGLVTEIREGETGPLLGFLNYHPTGLIQGVSHGNGVLDTLDQDPTGMARPAMMAAWVGTTPLWIAGPFAYDGAGNVTAIGSDSYDYDRVGRLTRGIVQGNVQEAAYDPYGNITRLVTGGRDANLQVDPATNRLSMLGVTYDTSGNLMGFNGISDAVYDPFNRMTELRATGVNHTYLYDADDNRVATLDPLARETRWTIRDRGERLLADFTVGWDTGDVALERDYVYRGGSLLASFDGATGKVRHYHLDHLGSTRLVTDGVGAVIGEYVYYPFGELVSATGDDRLLFTGHERDFNGTGAALPENDDLDYMLARHYAPRFGRFSSVDPVGGDPAAPQSWNLYSYVVNNPLGFADPSGEVEVASTAAALALCAYSPGSECSGAPGYVLKAAVSSSTTGFKASLWFNDEKNSYVLAFAGTEDLPRDGAEDLRQGLGLLAPQFDQAVGVARVASLTAWRQGADLTLTGHSLGGGLASMASLATSRHAITFNASGVHTNTIARHGLQGLVSSAERKIDAYYVRGEILNNSQDSAPLTALMYPTTPVGQVLGAVPQVLGRRRPLNPASGASRARLHAMAEVCKALSSCGM